MTARDTILEIVHEMDLFPTLAGIVGGRIPKDRNIAGVDQLDFLTGKKEKSNRASVITAKAAINDHFKGGHLKSSGTSC